MPPFTWKWLLSPSPPLLGSGTMALLYCWTSGFLTWVVRHLVMSLTLDSCVISWAVVFSWKKKKERKAYLTSKKQDMLGQLAISRYCPYPNLKGFWWWDGKTLIKCFFWPALCILGALSAGPWIRDQAHQASTLISLGLSESKCLWKTQASHSLCYDSLITMSLFLGVGRDMIHRSIS